LVTAPGSPADVLDHRKAGQPDDERSEDAVRDPGIESAEPGR
jgi:hypothetical protein